MPRLSQGARRRLRGGLGDLPGDYYRAGPMIDPTAGLALDWSNKYKTLQFGFIVNGTFTGLQGNALRTYLYIGNKSPATDLFVAFGTGASAFNGALIPPRGNLLFVGGEMGGSFCPPETVNLFSGAAVNVTVIEGTLMPYEVST